MDGILVGNGSDEILSMLFHALGGERRPGPISRPDLQSLSVLAEIREAKTKEVKLDERFGLDFSKFSKTHA